MASAPETEQQRSKRHRQRTLFDGVAELYQTTRLSYPEAILGRLISTARLREGSTILEVGCGTGQLTESLTGYGFNITAIDLGPSMVAAARQRVASSAVSFQVAPFEDFAAAESSFDLVVSATAFHWIDPEVRFAKAARLLRPGGWLAWLITGERYDDPFATALRDILIARSDDGGAFFRQSKPPPTPAELMEASGLFERPVHSRDMRPLMRPAELVIGVENTRATSLSWPADAQLAFTEELRQLLRGQAEVPLTQDTTLAMGRVLKS